jgi:hypothetical protein
LVRHWQRELGAVAFIVILVCLVFRQIALQGRVLAGFDAEVYFYPNAAYLVAGLRQGQLPLWNPYIFNGVPFLANSQVGALYPLSYAYTLGPVSIVANYLIVEHFVLFGIGIYLLARASLGLGRFGAAVAAAITATGGLAGGMVGHINQVEALAWAPFTVTAIERGVARRSLRLAVLGALPIALALFAGHTQVVYLSTALALAAGLSRLLQMTWVERHHRPQRAVAAEVARGLGRIAVAPLLALMLAGAQLVPTLELTRASIRATGLDFADAAAGSLPPPYLLISLLPTVGQPPSSTEWLAYVPISAMLLAVIGVWRRPRAEAWWLVAVAVLGLVLAMGQYTPLYRIAFAVAPGFRLFRVPARWLAVWVIALALLAGWGADVLTGARPAPNAAPPSDAAESWARRWLGRPIQPAASAAAVVLLAVCLLLTYQFRHLITRPNLATFGLWVGASLGVTLALWLTGTRSLARRAGLLLVLSLELVIASLTLPTEQAVWPAAVETPRETVTHLLTLGANDRVLGIGDNTFDPGDLGTIRAALDDSLPAAARDDYVTALKHVEGLTPNLPMRYGLRTIDGYDGGILPLEGYHAFKQLFAEEGTDVADGRLRIQLRSAPSASLLSWLNVRWLVMDRLRDLWVHGNYYDLSVLEPLTDETPLQLRPLQPLLANRIGVVLRGPGAHAPSGSLRVDTGGAAAILQTSPLTGTLIPTDPAVDPSGVWLWTVDLPAPSRVDVVTATWVGDAGTILRSLTAIDTSTDASMPVSVSPALVYSDIGDMKIYEVTTALPRAFLADSLDILPTAADAVKRMRAPTWSARAEAVAVAGDVSPSLAFISSSRPDASAITLDRPERVVVEADATDRRVLVLTDSYYSGWHALVDGVEQPIIPVNLLFRGVVLPPGHHVVDFVYRPLTWLVGLGLSVVGVAILLLALVRLSRRRSEVDVSWSPRYTATPPRAKRGAAIR